MASHVQGQHARQWAVLALSLRPILSVILHKRSSKTAGTQFCISSPQADLSIFMDPQ